jgi:hypothetical protein
MIAKKRLNHTGLPRLFLIPAVAFALIMVISGASQSWATGGMSTQTSCIANQPCHTVICREDQPCNFSESPNSESPNSDFAFDFDAQGPMAQPLKDAVTMEIVPHLNADNNGYLDDQEDYLEDMQDMMEDAEYE